MWQAKVWLSILCVAALSACGKVSTRAIASSANQVHYEGINDRGEFVTHVEFADDSDPSEDEFQKLAEKSAVVALANPDVRNRVSLVFVGDGYTRGELPQYNQDIANIRKLLAEEEPFKTYGNYFSMFSVQVISTQTGITDQPSSRLGMRYGCNGLDRLLCINSTRAMAEAQLAPKVDLVFALANSDRYGGAGYRTPAISTLAARNPAAVDLAVHEMGHSFADLADEYEDAGTGTGCTSKPNAADMNEAAMVAQKTKWYRWLDLKNVGTFAGSCYSKRLYRPTLNSKMRTLGEPFEQVNIEQFVLSIYQKVKPIEFATPTGRVAKNALLQVTPMKPNGHSLTVEWFLNGKLQVALTNSLTLDVSQLKLAAGSNVLKAKVTDKTTAVRDEEAREKLMSQTLSWTVRR